jgi:hypothetical protein
MHQIQSLTHSSHERSRFHRGISQKRRTDPVIGDASTSYSTLIIVGIENIITGVGASMVSLFFIGFFAALQKEFDGKESYNQNNFILIP